MQGIAMALIENIPNPQQSKTVPVSELKEQLIRACCRYQWMTVVDFWQWLHAVNDSAPTRNHVGKVVSGLAKDGYLHTFPLPKTRSGQATHVFVPGAPCRELLRKTGEEDKFLFNSPATMQGYSYSFMLHNLTVSRLAIGAALYFRGHPDCYLAETRLSYDMLRTPPRLSSTDAQTPLTAIPDLWLHIIADDGTEYPLWIEIDRGSETRATFQRLLRARLLYIISDEYQEYFGTRHVRLCYAVTSSNQPDKDNRLNTMLHWADEVISKENLHALAPFIRVTTITYETLYERLPRLFAEPVWYHPDNTSPVLLFSPITTQETSHEPDSDHQDTENNADHTDSGNTFQHLPQAESTAGLPV
jgi:hypothetical protein